MPRKCSVFNCKTGYLSQTQTSSSTEKISMFSFPKEEKERYAWVRALPNKLDKVTDSMGVCALHWPKDAPLVKRSSRHLVPTVPPSIFPNVPVSSIPTSNATTPRRTVKSTSSARAVDFDEMDQFVQNDTLKKDSFSELVLEKFKDHIVFTSDQKTTILSNSRDGPIFSFSIFIKHCVEDNKFSLSCELYHKVKRVFYENMNLKKITRWSELEEVVRFAANKTVDNDKKLNFLCHAIFLLNSPKNTRVYSIDDLIQAFSWLSKSRALYQELRDFIQLPSLATMKRITSISRNMDDSTLFTSVFSSLQERQRGCILIIDEVYVKASVTYRGGTLFGKAVDSPDEVANTVLSVMVKCFFGAHKFLAKLLPIKALKADFQFEVVESVIMELNRCGATVVAIINDNNRVNQSFFSLFEKFNASAPWIARTPGNEEQPLFLLYDTVHLVKNIRNSWLTEKTQTLDFKDDSGTILSAAWSDLCRLHNHQQLMPLKLAPDLREASIRPNNIEKQNVSLALSVFCDKTRAALQTSPVSTASARDTAAFIEKVVQLWKVINTKALFADIRHRDRDRAVVRDMNCHPIAVLRDWAVRAEEMESTSRPRMKKLTADTAKALQWTCKCLIHVSEYLLSTKSPFQHSYVPLGFFQQDDIEKHFGHFRMSAGCNYYITVEDIQHTNDADRAKLMLQCLVDNINYDNSGHKCSMCATDKLEMTDDELLTIDDMPNAVALTLDEQLSIFHISGYITFKEKLDSDPGSHSSDVKAYTEALDRGGLKSPSEALQTLVRYCYLFIKSSTTIACRKRLIHIFSQFPSILHIDVKVKKSALTRIVNTLLKRFALFQTNQLMREKDSKRRKISKLSSTAQ